MKYASTNDKGLVITWYMCPTLCNFQDGRTGKAIAVGTLSGDGEFPVFAEYQDEQICKIWIDFTINIDDTIDNE